MKQSSPISQTRTHLLKMRRLMRAEAAMLTRELTKHQTELKKRLQSLEKRLQKDSDTVLLADLGAIRDELTEVRRGLARLSISEQSTLKLKNEWHDWARHVEFSEGVDHALREERLEMLASELRLRGVHLRERRQEAIPAEPVALSQDAGLEAVEDVALEIIEDETPSLKGRNEEARIDWVAVSEYWDDLIASCHPRHTDTEQLARLLKAYRDVQGERKRHDKRLQVRRYRLQAFETWH